MANVKPTTPKQKQEAKQEANKMNLTNNFCFEEFVVTSNAKYAEENYKYGQDNLDKVRALAENLEKVRNIIRKPMIISSGVRCPGLNKALGGAKNSQHVKCEAVDFILKEANPKLLGSTMWWAYKKIRSAAIEFDQLIYEVRGETEWIHISFCDNNRRECLTFDGKKYTKINPKEVL